MSETDYLIRPVERDRNEHHQSFKDPRHICHRLIVLFLMCFLSFGSYFCYDIPASLHAEIVNDMDISETQYMQLYSWYSWPNVILCFFGGFLLDRVFGIRVGTILFGCLVMVGQLIFALGATFHHLWLMDMGRFIFGIGGESLAVAQNTFAVLWFKEKELNLVFGLQLSMARVGSTVNMNVMGPMYNWIKTLVDEEYVLGYSLFVASITCLLSLICGLVLCYLDKRAEKILDRQAESTDEVVKLTDVKDFSLQLWLVFLICVGYYVAIFPFIGLGKLFFEEKFGFSASAASAVNSIVYILSAPCSPILGFMVDRFGYNVGWLLLAIVMGLISHGLLAFTFANPWIAMCILGVSYSMLACALWPLVSFLVPRHQLATAYGFMQSIQNLGLGVISLVAGKLLDTKGYFVLEIFFIVCICFALISGLLLYFLDATRGRLLNASSIERETKKRTEENNAQIFGEGVATTSEQHFVRTRNPFALRNRYYSRIGAVIPEHLLAHSSVNN